MPGRDIRPRIVAIETTGRQGSVAVAADDELLGMTRFAADLQHAAELLPAIDRLCDTVDWRPDQIDEIYVSAGPGSFTGCRIGVTVARALAQAVSVRLVRVPTVDVLACNALEHEPPPRHLVVLLDAQRRQVYTAVFHLTGDDYVREGDVEAGDPEALLSKVPRPCATLGEGIAHHREAVEAADVEILPESAWTARADKVVRVGRRLARQGAYVQANELIPIYVRMPEAEERWQQRHGRPPT